MQPQAGRRLVLLLVGACCAWGCLCLLEILPTSVYGEHVDRGRKRKRRLSQVPEEASQDLPSLVTASMETNASVCLKHYC